MAVVVFDVGVEREFLASIDIGEPRGDLGALVATGSESQELVALNPLGGDDVHHRPSATVTGRGIGDDLDALDAVGGQEFEVLFEVFTAEVRGAVVEPHLYALRAAQGDVAFGIDLYARGVLQGVGGRAVLDGRVFGNVVELLLAIDGKEGPLGNDLHLLQGLGRRGEVDGVGLRGGQGVGILGVGRARCCQEQQQQQELLFHGN